MRQTSTPALAIQHQSSELRSIGPLTASAGAALLFGAIACDLSSSQSELTSELLCWLLLTAVFGISKRRRNADKHAEPLPLTNRVRLMESSVNANPSSISLWLVAISIAICSVFRAERGIIVLLPALAPLLIICHKHLGHTVYPHGGPGVSTLDLLNHNILGATLAAIFSITTLSEWDPIAYALSTVPVFALLIAYSLLSPHIGKQSRWLRALNIEAAAWPLSLRVALIQAIVLGGETYIVGFPSTNLTETLTLGSAKALTWYFALQLARNSSWLAVTIGGTFSLLATRDPFTQQTDTRAFMTVIASLVSLGQTVHLLPKQAKARSALWILALIPTVPYLTNLATIQVARYSALIHVEKHPVELLARKAQAAFDNLVQNQSKTYSAAYAQYQRRYGFEPPRGFEDWYKFAERHQSLIIDEFDIISEGVAPFLRLSGNEVLEIMTEVYDQPGHDLWSCRMSGEPPKTECSHHGRQNDRNNAQFFDMITSKIPSSLNLTFLLNHLDEPTVIIPPVSQQRQRPKIVNLGGQHAWKALTNTYLCEHAEYSELHGLLAAPESLRLTQGLVPILSTGAPSTMGDILYPSSAYVIEDRFEYQEEHDVDWDKKQNNLYWAGSTTGGHSREGQWQNLHRQRFVELAQNLKRQTFSYLGEKDGVISRAVSSFLNSRLYDVAFADVLQCDSKPCRDQRQYFRRKPWASGDRPYYSRLVFDLDGNGISGRYYKLLASKSTPLKQTILREWHDDRLMPWVHYIPVSQSMEELPELVSYLTSTESGQKRAKEIAEQGRLWFSKTFREIDVVIYMYRLFLELARLQDPDRPASKIDI
ncbi:hypothetical protein NUW58_g793 [Xylaria curta]|uniref:Uncharacterized protein n=1 Tax=Xylaria curta TaxID=42375 RepID=A0ACC1PQP1_9PEZI|nr:hypothetical protein NUW58_g793 [Xylaria curta]